MPDSPPPAAQDVVSGEIPQNVLVVNYRTIDWAYERLIPYMRETYGTRFVILTSKARAHGIKSSWCGPNDKVIAIEDMEAPNAPGTGGTLAEEIERARELESRLNITYMRDLIQPDRGLSTGFLSNAPWAPAAALKIPKSDDLIRTINGYLTHAETILEQEKIDLALAWPAEVLSASIATIAENKGIPVSYPHVSSRKSLLFWAPCAYMDDSQHRAAFENTPETEPVPISEVVPPATVTTSIMADLDKTHSFAIIAREVTRIIFHRLEFLALDIAKFDFKTKSRVSLLRSIVYLAYKYWFYKKMDTLSERRIEAFDEKPFIYYGLAIEPEFSVQVKSKEFNDQATIIRQIALSLPSGYELVIKEHATLGKRNLSFYKNLIKFPNIRMAHPTIRGIDLADKARAVATLVGTVTFEATLLGKPVVEFSTHSLYSFLPSVTTVTSLRDLPDILKKIMKRLNVEEKDKIRRDGARMLKAVESISFDGEGSPIFLRNDMQMDKEGVGRMASLLITLFQEKKAGLREKFATFP